MFNISQKRGDGLSDTAMGADGGGGWPGSVLTSAELGERTKRGKTAMAASGVMPSGVGFGPYGWDYDPELRRLVVNEAEAENMLRAYRAVADDGLTISGLVRQFNEEGIPAKRGGRWGYASMKSMLTNPAVKGEYYWGKTCRDRGLDGCSEKRAHVPREEWIRIADVCPAIVPADLFERVQAKLIEQRRASKAGRAA